MYSLFGHAFLNLAFILYLVLYLPQIYHNAKYQAFHRMSFLMHMMLLQAYSCDLFYGISKHMPWQYLSVSFIGLSCLLTQHLQWFMFKLRQEKLFDWRFLICGILAVLIPFLLWFQFPHAIWQFKIQAWVSRALFLLHFVPQIIKYHQNKLKRDAISLSYLSLSISLSICDLLAALCLNWDLANQVGSFASLALKLYLMYQITSKTLATANPNYPF
ncbi:MAG TPA: hypothetical protein DCZ80_03050 [Legionellales bacterium]|nr:hypothetical protein [Legionellales bacterium]